MAPWQPGTRIVERFILLKLTELAMIMLVLEDQKKPISSRDGMKLCVETSTTFDEWIRQSEQDYKDMLVYLKENDFKKLEN